jgi:predicted dehydrogenase
MRGAAFYPTQNGQSLGAFPVRRKVATMRGERSGDTISVGIAGCGAIAFSKHLPSLRKLAQVRIKGLYDRNRFKAENARRDFGDDSTQVHGTFEDLIADDRIDVVHVCTNNASHASMTIAALEAGKHVMCEKPMARNAEEARAMLEAARRTRKKLSISFQNRFRPEVQYLRALCENAELGDIYFAKAHAVRRRAVPTWGSFHNKTIQGGGCLIDIGSHALDLALWMMGKYTPRSVVGNVYDKLAAHVSGANAWGRWDPGAFTVEDAAFALITMEQGETIFLEASWALNVAEDSEAKVTLCGTKGGADMNRSLRITGEKFGQLFTTTVDMDAHTHRTRVKVESAADLEARLWIECIANDSEPVVKPEEALVVTEIIDAIYDSSAKKRPVHFHD